MKPHTNFRTVPVTERLPKVKGEYITSHKVTIQEFDPDYPQDIRYWKRLIEWWAEEIPEQAEVKPTHSDYLNMQYYMEYCLMNGYVTPQDWIEKYKHF